MPLKFLQIFQTTYSYLCFLPFTDKNVISSSSVADAAAAVKGKQPIVETSLAPSIETAQGPPSPCAVMCEGRGRLDSI